MRYITFSRQFPVYHPSKGRPTHFVEKICRSLGTYIDMNVKDINLTIAQSCEPKHHTIREGENWKAGYVFSPRIWSGRPYQSKQIEFTNPIVVAKVFKFSFYRTHEIHIDGKFYCSTNSDDYLRLATNDGLTAHDFLYWFMYSRPPRSFHGQIICWNETIQY